MQEYLSTRNPEVVYVNVGKNHASGLMTDYPSEEMIGRAVPKAKMDKTVMNGVL